MNHCFQIAKSQGFPGQYFMKIRISTIRLRKISAYRQLAGGSHAAAMGQQVWGQNKAVPPP
jgi:hypothetical protein